MKNLIVLGVILFMFSCKVSDDSGTSNTLKLEIITDTIIITDTTHINRTVDRQQYANDNSSFLNYQLINNTGEKFLIVFERDNVIARLKTAKGENLPIIGRGYPNFGGVDPYPYDAARNNEIVERYIGKGYPSDTTWILRSNYIAENHIIINPGDTLNFRKRLTIPVEFGPHGAYMQYINWKETEKYYFELRIVAPLHVAELNHELARDVEKNNYSIFNGTLKSNTVPVIIAVKK